MYYLCIMKTISLKLLTREDIELLESLKKQLGESASTVIRQAMRFYSQSLSRPKRVRKERAA